MLVSELIAHLQLAPPGAVLVGGHGPHPRPIDSCTPTYARGPGRTFVRLNLHLAKPSLFIPLPPRPADATAADLVPPL
jgi:hypothetical protein